MEKYDLLVVADATASMRNYLTSLNTSLPQIISIFALTGCFSRVGVIAYRDYTDFDDYISFSGWLDMKPEEGVEQPDIVGFAKSLKAKGGGDYPEATKTGLAKAYEVMREDATTVILLYTDAPPHTIVPQPEPLTNPSAEMKALLEPGYWLGEAPYGGFGPLFSDWVRAGKTLASPTKKAQVFALLEWDMVAKCATYYNFLCEMTGGACIHLNDSLPETISKASVELLLLWMGLEKPGNDVEGGVIPGDWTYYLSTEGMKELEGEADPKTERFFPVPYTRRTQVLDNIKKVTLTRDIMVESLPKKSVPVRNPNGRWETDTAYREVASAHLMRVIKEDICAISPLPPRAQVAAPSTQYRWPQNPPNTLGFVFQNSSVQPDPSGLPSGAQAPPNSWHPAPPRGQVSGPPAYLPWPHGPPNSWYGVPPHSQHQAVPPAIPQARPPLQRIPANAQPRGNSSSPSSGSKVPQKRPFNAVEN